MMSGERIGLPWMVIGFIPDLDFGRCRIVLRGNAPGLHWVHPIADDLQDGQHWHGQGHASTQSKNTSAKMTSTGFRGG